MRWMQAGVSPGMNRLYSAIGWKHRGSMSSASANPDLRLSTLCKMADALKADRLSFLETVLEEYRRSGHLPPPPSRTLDLPISEQVPVPRGSRAEAPLGS